ncbi:MAG: valine--tRNA ligase, partial [Rhodospirillales bacterium]|nr:valine--tRNA ligase [Rhodospirillales bacterium]
RYTDLVGKRCILPIVDRPIPVVADEYADPEKGTGAVKITPAHDFNDFEVGRRHDLEMINVLTADASMNDAVPERYRGLDRYEARDAIVREMETFGLLERVEEHLMMVPYGDRSGVVIEPWLTDQWFVDAKTLAEPAIAAVESGRTRFIPEQWEKTYFEWMRNIQPWCISRQIWWGHQVPAWYGPDGAVFVEMSEAEAESSARAHYGEDVELTRDSDVLDTWFSSALWPFSTLGWPDRTPEVERYYPTDVLVTGFDIIFFWVARMMMMGMHFMGEVPFHTVYIHALVRDEKGQKMSKSKGNVIDPLKLIDEYGADALRFTLAAFAAQGRDIKMSEARVAGYRNFGTKLWNAARFCQVYDCRPVRGFDPFDASEQVNRWLAGKVAETSQRVAEAIEGYRFNEAAGALYQFVWGTFCDWYLEFVKPILLGGSMSAQAETRATAAWALDQILHLLHPFMPFISEELFQETADRDGELLMMRPWPSFDLSRTDAVAAKEMDWVVRLISLVRSVRAEMNVPPGAEIPLLLRDAGEETRDNLTRNRQLIESLARLSSIELLDGNVPQGSIQSVLDEVTVVLPLADVIDVEAERARLTREIAKLDKEIIRFDVKLANDKFLSKAPPEVVETERERRDEAIQARTKLQEAAKRLAAFV